MRADMDWQKKLSDDFDIDGYSMPQASAKDVHGKFCKAKADGMREAAEIAEQFSGSGEPSEYALGADDAIRNAARYILDAASKLHPTE